MSTKRFGPLDEFKLFYEELVIERPTNRIRRFKRQITARPRQVSVARAN